jgi:hypothetical protein
MQLSRAVNTASDAIRQWSVMMQFHGHKEQDEVGAAPSSEQRYFGHGSDHVPNLELVPCLRTAPW